MDSEHTWSTDFARGLLEGAGYRSTIIPRALRFGHSSVSIRRKFVDAKIANDRVRSADIRELLDNPFNDWTNARQAGCWARTGARA